MESIFLFLSRTKQIAYFDASLVTVVSFHETSSVSVEAFISVSLSILKDVSASRFHISRTFFISCVGGFAIPKQWKISVG